MSEKEHVVMPRPGQHIHVKLGRATSRHVPVPPLRILPSSSASLQETKLPSSFC